MGEKRRDTIAFVTILYMGVCLMYHLYTAPPPLETDEDSIDITDQKASPAQRRPLSDFIDEDTQPLEPLVKSTNCTPPDIEQFPRPLVGPVARRQGGLALHIFVSLYMLLGLAILCDEYFVPSLEKICKLLNVQSDVAGATFMAAGSSAPELATAVIAVFVAQDDIGIGTVVGSAVFNIAFVIGFCGVFAGQTIPLNWWPLFRDCMFYLISILALLFALRDETVGWMESLLFLVLYVFYIVFISFNKRVEKWIKGFSCLSCLTPRVSGPPIHGVAYHALPDRFSNVEIPDTKLNGSDKTDSTLEASEPFIEEEETTVFSPPNGKIRKMFWVLSLPFLVGCFLTIPDCRLRRWEKCFLVTFLSSCLWIGVLSYVLVWMITIIGFTLHIKDTVMGLTFLAAGASIPDAITSLIVAREGLGDMAVSNAVGSNVFDILVCLGIPWFLQTAIISPGSHIKVRSRGLTYSTLTLLLTVVLLLVATHLNRWKLDKKYGFVLLVWYLIFMVVAVLYESSIFGNIAQLICPSNY